MAQDAKFNFRSTNTFVTDGAGETYVLASDSYPTIRNGETFGWVGTVGGARDRNAGVDPRLAGIHFINTGTDTYFRVDLPATGEYQVYAAFGDYSSNNRVEWLLQDSTTTFQTITNGGAVISAQTWHDATNTLRTLATWPGSNAAVSRTFTSTQFRLLENVGAVNTSVAHLRIVQAGGSNNELAVDSGSITITGSNANLKGGYLLSAGSGMYSTTGQNSTLGLVRKLLASAGIYSLSGNSTGLTVDRKLSVDTGSYSQTGTAAVLTVDRVISPDSGEYLSAGTTADLIHFSPGAYTLDAEGGNFAVQGQAAEIRAERLISLGSGSYAILGASIETLITRGILAVGGTYEVTGTAAGLNLSGRITVVGPVKWAAGEVYLPGFKSGEIFLPGFKSGGVYRPGFQEGETT